MPPATKAYYMGRVASLSRSRTPDDPELIEARQGLKALMAAQFIEKVLTGNPPLTDEQRADLADQLRGTVA